MNISETKTDLLLIPVRSTALDDKLYFAIIDFKKDISFEELRKFSKDVLNLMRLDKGGKLVTVEYRTNNFDVFSISDVNDPRLRYFRGKLGKKSYAFIELGEGDIISWDSLLVDGYRFKKVSFYESRANFSSEGLKFIGENGPDRYLSFELDLKDLSEDKL